MTATGERPADRYARIVREASGLQAAQLEARRTWEARVEAEERLDEALRELDRVTGIGPGTWWARLTGRGADAAQQVTETVRQQEALTARTVAEHQAAAGAMARAQAAADALPPAREAAVAALQGPAADEAGRALAAAQELAEAIFTANSASLVAADVVSELATAEGWSTYDTFLGGGLVASGMKQDSIYRSNDKAAVLTDLLMSLRAELQALQVPTSYFAIQMNDPVASIDLDLWWDNVFTDYAMAKRIDSAQDRIQRLQNGLTQLVATLGDRRNQLLAEVDALVASELGTGPAPDH